MARLLGRRSWNSYSECLPDLDHLLDPMLKARLAEEFAWTGTSPGGAVHWRQARPVGDCGGFRIPEHQRRYWSDLASGCIHGGVELGSYRALRRHWIVYAGGQTAGFSGRKSKCIWPDSGESGGAVSRNLRDYNDSILRAASSVRPISRN